MPALALDWQHAFDSALPESLSAVQKQFGVPGAFVEMVNAVYHSRRFRVRDGRVLSSWHEQSFGISQGCRLNPFLFVILMSVLLQDAKSSLTAMAQVPTMLVYAEGTLLLGIDIQDLQQFMSAIGQAGRTYGLSFNLRKEQQTHTYTQKHARNKDYTCT